MAYGLVWRLLKHLKHKTRRRKKGKSKRGRKKTRRRR